MCHIVCMIFVKEENVQRYKQGSAAILKMLYVGVGNDRYL